MNALACEVHRQSIEKIADEFRLQGYNVQIEPEPTNLPPFLVGYKPDILASKENDSVVVEVKIGTRTAVTSERLRELSERIQREPGWRFSLVIVDPQSDEVAPSTMPLVGQQKVVEQLHHANELQKTGAKDAAFVLLWVAVEALLRHLAQRESLPLERVPTSSLMKELYSLGLLSRSELELVQGAYLVRNAYVHGFSADETTGMAPKLSHFAEQLVSSLWEPNQKAVD